MTLTGAMALFLLMAALAALPSASSALVVVRAAAHGLGHGIAVALGIALGDLIFVALAIAGLAAMAEIMGAFFTLLRYVAAGLLVWFGLGLIRSKPVAPGRPVAGPRGGIWVSLAAGLVLTLGDVKAILFYAALFPVVVDLPGFSASDMVVVGVITLLAVGGAKIAYAMAAQRIAAAAGGWRFRRPAQKLAGGAMIAAGGALAFKP